MAVEVVDYTGHINAAEEETVAALARSRVVIDGLISARGGRIFTTAPNNVLSEFESPVEAVRCALEVQESVGISRRNSEIGRPLQFRIGVHTGDVLRTGDNLLGDAVNIAARLESVAEPGSIFISREVKHFIEDKLSLQFRFQGNRTLKNIPRPIATYEVSASRISNIKILWRRGKNVRRRTILSFMLSLSIAVFGYLAYDSYQRLRRGTDIQNSLTLTILQKDPAPGTLAYGKKVLVNDGSCPTGQIKEITGGNTNIGVPRARRCIGAP